MLWFWHIPNPTHNVVELFTIWEKYEWFFIPKLMDERLSTSENPILSPGWWSRDGTPFRNGKGAILHGTGLTIWWFPEDSSGQFAVPKVMLRIFFQRVFWFFCFRHPDITGVGEAEERIWSTGETGSPRMTWDIFLGFGWSYRIFQTLYKSLPHWSTRYILSHIKVILIFFCEDNIVVLLSAVHTCGRWFIQQLRHSWTTRWSQFGVWRCSDPNLMLNPPKSRHKLLEKTWMFFKGTHFCHSSSTVFPVGNLPIQWRSTIQECNSLQNLVDTFKSVVTSSKMGFSEKQAKPQILTLSPTFRIKSHWSNHLFSDIAQFQVTDLLPRTGHPGEGAGGGFAHGLLEEGSDEVTLFLWSIP